MIRKYNSIRNRYMYFLFNFNKIKLKKDGPITVLIEPKLSGIIIQKG